MIDKKEPLDNSKPIMGRSDPFFGWYHIKVDNIPVSVPPYTVVESFQEFGDCRLVPCVNRPNKDLLTYWVTLAFPKKNDMTAAWRKGQHLKFPLNRVIVNSLTPVESKSTRKIRKAPRTPVDPAPRVEKKKEFDYIEFFLILSILVLIFLLVIHLFERPNGRLDLNNGLNKTEFNSSFPNGEKWIPPQGDRMQNKYDFEYTIEIPTYLFSMKSAIQVLQQQVRLKSCTEIQNILKWAGFGHFSGQNPNQVFKIYPEAMQGPKKVLCDFETDGGGWTVIQGRNENGSHIDFNRGWKEYENGFGQVDTGNYWLGLNAMFSMTHEVGQELMIELEEEDGRKVRAKYSNFRVLNNWEKYSLNVGGYRGNKEDRMMKMDGNQFSTWDQDNDKNSWQHYAKLAEAGWWYGGDFPDFNLNAPYFVVDDGRATGISTGGKLDGHGLLKRVDMKIRPWKSAK